jgi:hypothetical protein
MKEEEKEEEEEEEIPNRWHTELSLCYFKQVKSVHPQDQNTGTSECITTRQAGLSITLLTYGNVIREAMDVEPS